MNGLRRFPLLGSHLDLCDHRSHVAGQLFLHFVQDIVQFFNMTDPAGFPSFGQRGHRVGIVACAVAVGKKCRNFRRQVRAPLLQQCVDQSYGRQIPGQSIAGGAPPCIDRQLDLAKSLLRIPHVVAQIRVLRIDRQRRLAFGHHLLVVDLRAIQEPLQQQRPGARRGLLAGRQSRTACLGFIVLLKRGQPGGFERHQRRIRFCFRGIQIRQVRHKRFPGPVFPMAAGQHIAKVLGGAFLHDVGQKQQRLICHADVIHFPDQRLAKLLR